MTSTASESTGDTLHNHNTVNKSSKNTLPCVLCAIAVASGPVLAGPVSVFAFKTVHAQMINNKAIVQCSAWMQHCDSNDSHQLVKVTAAAINTNM